MTPDKFRDLEQKVQDMSEAIVEHRMRLENGTKVFSQISDRIERVEINTAPKPPPSAIKIISITLGVAMALVGALWTVSMMFGERPTALQLEKAIKNHDVSGHAPLRDDIRSIQINLGKQRVLIEGVKKDQDKQNQKLDRVLERLPKRRSRRRRR